MCVCVCVFELCSEFDFTAPSNCRDYKINAHSEKSKKSTLNPSVISTYVDNISQVLVNLMSTFDSMIRAPDAVVFLKQQHRQRNKK